MIKKQRITLWEIKHSPNKETAYLIFKLNETFEFKEGQFLMIEKEINGKKIKRAYSIANTFLDSVKTGEIHFFVKRTSEEGLSHFLTQKIGFGDFVDISGPYGSATNDFQIDNYLLISIGSGCACTIPIYQKIVFEEMKYNKICTLFGEKTFEYIVQKNKDTFAKEVKNAKNMFFLSREKTLENQPTKSGILEIEKGHISDGLSRAMNFLDTSQVKVFVCGKPEMVDQVSKTLIENYLIDKQNIKFEKY